MMMIICDQWRNFISYWILFIIFLQLIIIEILLLIDYFFEMYFYMKTMLWVQWQILLSPFVYDCSHWRRIFLTAYPILHVTCVQVILNFFTPSGRIGKVVVSHTEGCKVARSNPSCGWAAPIYTMHEALMPMRVEGAASQLDLPSLTPLSVAVVVDCN